MFFCLCMFWNPESSRPVFRGSTVKWRVIRGETTDGEESKMDSSSSTTSTLPSIFDSTCWGFYLAGIGRKISPGLRLRKLLENLQETEIMVGFDRWTQDYDIALGE